MPPRRQTTLFDLSSLRVHPDGTRVDQTDYNLRVERHARAARDAHGNWMAQDAGGSVAVKRRLKQKEGKQAGEDIAKDDADDAEEAVAQALKPRAAKRQKFSQDYSFLEALELSNISQTPAEAEELPVPSSDLLKCIHYMASTYYAEQGLLINASKRHRALGRQRRLEKMTQTEQANDEVSEDESDEDDETSSSESEEGLVERKHRRKYEPGEKDPGTRDMYRTMDGSALMAIGVLVQEHVARLLDPRIPDGWEDNGEDVQEGVGAD
ncbi:hypothetical protein BDZ89DRAFT_1154102 [Hymenopellis radicata]|nr:hypothetical protein BDZ89DRAFT_1154102 [Hymenopellis radicata]